MSKRRYTREQEKHGDFLNGLLAKFNEHIPDQIVTAPNLRIYPELLCTRLKLHNEWKYYVTKNNFNAKRMVKLEHKTFNQYSFLVIVTFILREYYNCENPDPQFILQHFADGLDFEESAAQIIANENFRDR